MNPCNILAFFVRSFEQADDLVEIEVARVHYLFGAISRENNFRHQRSGEQDHGTGAYQPLSLHRDEFGVSRSGADEIDGHLTGLTRYCLHLKKCVYILSFALRDRMVRTLLNDEVWDKVRDVLPGKEGDRGRTACSNRRFLEAVLWIARTGSPWRDLPAEFGRWHTVYMRFSRWRSKGVWQRVVNALAGQTQIEHILIDSTIVRAHQHSAGALKKTVRKRLDVPEAD